ncbi:MAG: nucleotidyltransferase family protein [Clostridia bacterium]|nr:nucleotidyltransferase family protein [Clostridia bacterium]
MNNRDLLLALLKVAINGDELASDSGIKDSLSSERLTTLFKISKKHDVAHLVAYALEENGFSCSNEVWQLFLKEKEQAILRYEMMQADINEICSCFETNGIDYMPLKGAVLRSIYPEPWMRTSCDIDILVHEEELDRAVQALVKDHSYRVEGKKNYHDISLYSPFGMHLELHHNIKETIDKYDELLTQVWTFSRKSQENGHSYAQTNEFLMFHLIAHMAYHFVGGGCGLRSVLDIWLLKKEREFDNTELCGFLDKAMLTSFFETIMMLAEYWFGEGTITSSLVLETEKYVLLGGAYGTSQQNIVSKQIQKGGKFKYIMSRIFIPYESLSILYPIVKKHKVLIPFCQMLRWLSVPFKGKKLSREMKSLSSVTKDEIDQIDLLLKKLRL